MVRQPPTDPKRAASERRKAKRVVASLPFRLMADGKEESFELVDLSESGARIRAQHAVAPMTRIQVRILLPGEKVGTKNALEFDTHGVVVWSHKEPKASTYDTGVFFAELDDRQRNLLRTFVGSHA